MGRIVSPFRRYRLITEDVLSPAKKRMYIGELHKRGWIHPNTFQPRRYKNFAEMTFIEISCTPEHLGRVCGYMLNKEKFVIIEQL